MKRIINKRKLIFCIIALFTISTTVISSCDPINIEKWKEVYTDDENHLTLINLSGTLLTVNLIWESQQDTIQEVAVVSLNNKVEYTCQKFPGIFMKELKANKRYNIKIQAAVLNGDSTLTMTKDVYEKTFKTGDKMKN